MAASFSLMLPRTWQGRVALGLLVVVFLAVGMLREPLLDGLQALLSPGAALPQRDITSLRRTGGAVFTTRPILPMATYGALYVGVSVGLLHLLLGAQWRRTRVLVLLFAGAIALSGALLALGRLTGQSALLTPPARALIDLLTSPTPVLLALAVFWLVVPRLQAPARKVP